MTQFEIGKKYTMFSPCDQECIWAYEVIARTAQTITLRDEYSKVKKCRVSKVYSEYNKAETVFPLGQYSMCPILRAQA